MMLMLTDHQRQQQKLEVPSDSDHSLKKNSRKGMSAEEESLPISLANDGAKVSDSAEAAIDFNSTGRIKWGNK